MSRLSVLFTVLLVGLTPTAAAEPLSGYDFAGPETRAMQDDDFANPGGFWLEHGEELWNTVEGSSGRSCASCHDSQDMRGVAPAYPKVDPESGALMNLELRVNACRERHMEAAPYALESDHLLSLVLFVRRQSQGMPMHVSADGLAAPFYERGRALYGQRRGQMNLACVQCHDERAGLFVRGERLSQGQVNGFPAYLLRWGAVGSAHRRFQVCDDQALAEPLAIGSADYLALELYVATRGNGLPVEAPAVRR